MIDEILNRVADTIKKEAYSKAPIETGGRRRKRPNVSVTAGNTTPYEYCPVPINESTWPIVLEMVVDGEAPLEWADYVENYLLRAGHIEP